MHIVCLDLEGVLVPEIWIEFSKVTGITELKRTTRDEPDYDKLMNYRLDILKEKGLKLKNIQDVIATMDPLSGAKEFVEWIKERTQLIILSDTFTQFAQPLMKKLGYPTLFCNELIVSDDNFVTGYTLRQPDGKIKAVNALKSINMKIFAAGDSYNDLTMIKGADKGMFFRSPESIRAENPDIPACEEYEDLKKAIETFLNV